MNEEERLEKRRRHKEIQIKYSRIPEMAFREHRVQNFIVRPGTEKAYKAVLYYLALNGNLEPFDEEQFKTWDCHHFLTLCGGPGKGKTHLALTIGVNQFEGGLIVQYWHVEELLDALRSSFNDGTEGAMSFEMIIGTAKNVDWLILDDLGAEQSTPWAQAKLDELIDHRYVNGGLTVVTTNLKLSQLPPRIASRLSEGEIVLLECDDFRPLKAKMREQYKRQLSRLANKKKEDKL